MALLKTIFDLPTKKEELSSMNQNMSDIFYREVQPLRNLQDSTTTSNFGQGIISLRWDLDSQTWWIPSKSYFRFRVQYLDADDNALEVSDNIAPAMGVAGNLFQKIQFKMSNSTICSVDENLAECEAFATRQMKTGQWMRDLGNNINFWESKRDKRVQEISNDGLLGKCVTGVSSGVQITDGLDLGFTAASTFAFTAATNLVTFAVAPARIEDSFQIGDILVVRLTGEVFRRAFYVLGVNAGLILQTATFGTNIAGNIAGTVLLSLKRYRYGDKNVYGYTKSGIHDLLTQPSTAGNSLSTANAGILDIVDPGDVWSLTPAGTRFAAVNINRKLTATTAQGASFNVGTAIAANATNELNLLKYRNVEVVDLLDLGYEQSAAAANGHAVLVAPDAGGDAILTITRIGTGGEIPDVNSNFQVGDIVTVRLVANPFFQGLVTEVDPNSDGSSLRVVGEAILGANKGAAGDAENFMFKRIRYNAKDSLKAVNSARQVKDMEIIWKPASLPIFNTSHAIPGGTLFEFELDPFQNTFYQRRAIESASGSQLISGTDFKFLVTDLRLYIAQCQGPIVEKMEYMIDMNRVKCHKTSLTTNSTTTTSIDVQPSSYALSLAFADKRTGNRSDLNPSKFKILNDDELNLNRYSIRFAGKSLPDPDFDGEFDASSGIDHLTYMYTRNMLYNGAYFDNSQETLDEWRERGIYFYHPFLRSGTNKESRCYIVTQFGNAFSDATNVNLMLFENYKSVAIVKMDNGRVYNVKRSDS